MEEEINDEAKAIQATQGYKKLWNYFLDLVETPKFQKEIKQIRRDNGIPENGTQEKESGPLDLKLTHDIDGLCMKYGLDAPVWEDSLITYVIFNELWKPKYANLFYVADTPEEREEPWIKAEQKFFDEVYPIALKISPYASQRDIIDYVKKNYKIQIESVQKKYKRDLNLGKVRSKKDSIRERNKFIYEHRELPRKKIMSLANDKFGINIDYGLVGKIISLERKRRKDVRS